MPKKSETQEKIPNRGLRHFDRHTPANYATTSNSTFCILVLFSNGQIALPSMELLAPDHLRQDIYSPYRQQPHHRPIRIFGWMDSYAVLAAALFIIPSLCAVLEYVTLATLGATRGFEITKVLLHDV